LRIIDKITLFGLQNHNILPALWYPPHHHIFLFLNDSVFNIINSFFFCQASIITWSYIYVFSTLPY